MEARRRIIGILALFVVLTASTADHAIYISVVDLSYQKGSNSKLTIKVFSDDLQSVIRNFGTDYKHASLSEFAEKNSVLIERYFNENFQLRVNDVRQKLLLTKSSIESNAHFLSFDIQNKDTWKNLDIKGSFFTEVFPDQSNVLTVSYKGKKHYSRLTKSNPSYSINF